MVERIGSGGALAREALLAAMRASERAGAPAPGVDRAGELSGLQQADPARAGDAPDFAGALSDGIQAVERHVDAAESMPADLLSGRVDDFHEIAVSLKSAELSFRFAMEIRNKLVDAYREIMRMSV